MGYKNCIRLLQKILEDSFTEIRPEIEKEIRKEIEKWDNHEEKYHGKKS